MLLSIQEKIHTFSRHGLRPFAGFAGVHASTIPGNLASSPKDFSRFGLPVGQTQNFPLQLPLIQMLIWALGSGCWGKPPEPGPPVPGGARDEGLVEGKIPAPTKLRRLANILTKVRNGALTP